MRICTRCPRRLSRTCSTAERSTRTGTGPPLGGANDSSRSARAARSARRGRASCRRAWRSTTSRAASRGRSRRARRRATFSTRWPSRSASPRSRVMYSRRRALRPSPCRRRACPCRARKVVRGVRSSCVTAETNTCRRSLSLDHAAARRAGHGDGGQERERPRAGQGQARGEGPVLSGRARVRSRGARGAWPSGVLRPGAAPAATGSSPAPGSRSWMEARRSAREPRPVEPAPLHVDGVAGRPRAARALSAVARPTAPPASLAGGNAHPPARWHGRWMWRGAITAIWG